MIQIKKYKMKYILYTIKLCLVLFTVIQSSSCKKLIEVDSPYNSVNGTNVYATDATAISVLNGIYGKLSQTSNMTAGGLATISVYAGLSADELELFNGVTSGKNPAFFQNNLAANVSGFEYWQDVYPYIFTCNDAIEGINASSSITPYVKTQLLGEAKFMRAFFYFYLINLYGDVPLILDVDYDKNRNKARSSKEVVYNQIINDLKDAQGLLSENYLNGSLQKYTGVIEKVRPTKWAATALLSRTFLFTGDWANAEMESSSLINNSVFDTIPLNSVFLKNSKETIWQLQPVNTGRNTEDAFLYILPNSPAGVSVNKPFYISQFLLNAFEPNDKRKINWLGYYSDLTGGYYYPNKYKSGVQDAPVTEYLTVFRLAEQYLIRAEARAQLNNINESQKDLNVIRKRAGLPNTGASDKISLAAAVLKERQVEFFTEWGHRWLDLKRTGNIDSVMKVVTPKKANGINWRSYQQLYPLPLNDIEKSTSLIQNDGY